MNILGSSLLLDVSRMHGTSQEEIHPWVTPDADHVAGKEVDLQHGLAQPPSLKVTARARLEIRPIKSPRRDM
jgi:hypothetical protein